MESIAGTLFRSSTDLIVGTAFDTLISSPTEYLVRLHNAVISGFPALEKWFQKWEPQPGIEVETGTGTEAGTVPGTTTGTTRITKSGTGWGMGVAGGRGREMEIVQRGFPGWKVRK
ncbi:MAG: hypothetical protein IKF99_19270 [Oscillospiraceae bacterium]|nr:hypothetical protein [Oscillospiraceae bacterium]